MTEQSGGAASNPDHKKPLPEGAVAFLSLPLSERNRHAEPNKQSGERYLIVNPIPSFAHLGAGPQPITLALEILVPQAQTSYFQKKLGMPTSLTAAVYIEVMARRDGKMVTREGLTIGPESSLDVHKVRDAAPHVIGSGNPSTEYVVVELVLSGAVTAIKSSVSPVSVPTSGG